MNIPQLAQGRSCEIRVPGGCAPIDTTVFCHVRHALMHQNRKRADHAFDAMRKARHIMTVYRRHLLGCKKKWGSARGLIHYRALVDSYLKAKRAVLAGEELVDA
jgi:hypothetical protein